MMKDLLELLGNPFFWKIILGYWIFSAFAGALPTPTTSMSPLNQFYQFVFRFVHIISGNMSRAAVAFKVPGAKEDQP